MNILIPMAGAGTRFKMKGFQKDKPFIPVTSLLDGYKVPMVVAAIQSLPMRILDQLILVCRNSNELENELEIVRKYLSINHSIVTQELTSGQASTCMLAKDIIDNDRPLLISACDHGAVYDFEKFFRATQNADCLVFTCQGRQVELASPEAYSWVSTDAEGSINNVSVKKALSHSPCDDLIVIGTFWFKHGSHFVEAAKKMIACNEQINNEFYVDQIINYLIKNKLNVRSFSLDNFFCWGTPEELNNYESSINYWNDFILKVGLNNE